MKVIILFLLAVTIGSIIKGYITSDTAHIYFGWKTFDYQEGDTFTLGISQNVYFTEDEKDRMEVFTIGLYFIGLSFIFEKENA